VSLLAGAAAAGHTLTLVPLPGQAVVLALTLGCGIWAARANTRLALLALMLCAAVWLRANSQLEGAVLWTVTPAHGLTLADLVVPLLGALVLAGRGARWGQAGTGRRQAVPNRARERAIARSRSTSRFFGGAVVTR
jgi:hypothetical protein